MIWFAVFIAALVAYIAFVAWCVVMTVRCAQKDSERLREMSDWRGSIYRSE